MDDRKFGPVILETKQNLLMALKSGEVKTSKYNLLSPKEKLFVEMVVFGDYTAAKAMKMIDPGCRNYSAAANKLLANPDVASTIEELTVQKDKKFAAELSSAADMALAKLKYIMTTTQDETLAAGAATKILDVRTKMQAQQNKQEKPGGVTEVRYRIQVENMPARGTPDHDPIILEADMEEVPTVEEKPKKKATPPPPPRKRDPKTGLPYVIAYEGVNSYEEE